MNKSYVVEKNFRIGEIDIEVKKGTKLLYDIEKKILTLNGMTYDVKFLSAVIKAKWLLPEDNVYPELDGPVGETADEAAERKRKERFNQMETSRSEGNNPLMKKDERIIAGAYPEGSKEYNEALNIVGVAGNTKKKKFETKVVADDSKVISSVDLSGDKELQSLKSLNNSIKKSKAKEAKDFKVYQDQFDVGEKVASVPSNLDNLIKKWDKMHWIKKADVIKKADSTLLKELKTIETSQKIINRIEKQLSSL